MRNKVAGLLTEVLSAHVVIVVVVIVIVMGILAVIVIVLDF